ncbi:hypothetical protein GGR44_002014 [Sphingobium fontiphilum]|uniref:Uncharacterized protein n=1 Tax=Sphingobium fontiphilum TaxID=944425 RepID=A0A7W6GNI7_9SPHN|nr:hypothetical protein [Sphingobium fontiphilum]MBB3982351.1 hypothetical protein [Sphingobium fontiphilum]
MAGIGSREELEAWLKDKPREWAQVIAARAALRALPFGLGVIPGRDGLTDRFALALFRATAISWAARNFPTYDIVSAAAKAAANATAAANAAAANADARATIAAAANAAAITATANATARAAIAAANATSVKADAKFWKAVDADCDRLTKRTDMNGAAHAMNGLPLWLSPAPDVWARALDRRSGALLDHDPSFQVWTDWYLRRVDGLDAAFDIPGDINRKEDKAILARLADATDEDFWGKGAHHVNTTLQGWIDEARAAAELPLPEQEDGATAYDLNDAGQVDRLPASDQQHLRDAPDQRRNYADIREAAQELAEEGQRLGGRLRRALDRFLASLPEAFEQAEAYLVWRDGNALRRIHRAHRLVADSREPDDARLDPMVGEMLGGLIDLYNLFAFGDDGLRTLDERRVAAQERARADVERAAAKPLVEAALRAPDVATARALDDLKAETEAETLPPGDPYADQAADQASRVRRNWFAALLSGGKRALNELNKSGKSVRVGIEGAVGATIISDLTGVTQIYRPVLDFIKDNAEALTNYAVIAYGNNPAVARLIEAILKLWPF